MVIHRDIKPANLIRRADGTIALVDFGAAHVQGTTAGSTSIGTFGYMPIEQLAGIVDATTDVYALGASLLHLLTRREPWRLAQNKTMRQRVGAAARVPRQADGRPTRAIAFSRQRTRSPRSSVPSRSLSNAGRGASP